MEPGTPRDGDCMRPPLVLTIAASESDGAAGLQADLKTFAAPGDGAHGTRRPPAAVVRTRIEAVAEALRLDATRIGALGSAAVVDALADAVRTHRARVGRIVPGPVMVRAHGTPLIRAEGAA